MKKILIISFCVFFPLFISCGGSGGDDGNNGGGNGGGNPPGPVAPKPATLLKPANNSECLELDAVKFEWNKSDNTTSYTIVVKNLLNQASISQTTTSTNVEITLTKGFPYSWYVISTNTGTATATSAKWKFYLSGTPQKNHAPFPAEIVAPKPGATVNLGSVQLSWSFSDVDSGDTHTFDIYLDQKDATTVNVSNYAATKKTISINDTGTYYWRIITKDNHGATSDSGVSTFVVIE
ncbi:MAG: hypothetical protein H8E55_50655 [Pelagibacterales bacterium]|nr:hypothetical protein [Pelagibacterales bacterium]